MQTTQTDIQRGVAMTNTTQDQRAPNDKESGKEYKQKTTRRWMAKERTRQDNGNRSKFYKALNVPKVRTKIS